MPQSAPLRIDTIAYLGGITALTAISIDIILPATAVIARDFGVREQLGALLIGSYFIAYALGQLFWGLFSDAFGRRTALILSLVGFIPASIACIFAPSFGFLVAMRMLQGLMGGTPVIARAMVRDITSGREAARMMAVLTAILTIATLIAPVIGSGLLVLFDWRAIFAALSLLGIGLQAYTLFKLEETAGQRRPERFRLSFLKSAGSKLLRMREFLLPMAVGSLTFGGYAAVLSVGAVVVETTYGVSPAAFGSIFAIAALFNFCGAMLARQLLKSMDLKQVALVAVVLIALAGISQLTIAFSTPSLIVFWAGVCLYVMAFGVILPTTIAAAMEPADEFPGFAASMMGAIQMSVGAGGALLATALFDGSHRAVSLTMGLFAIAATIAFFLGRLRPRSAP